MRCWETSPLPQNKVSQPLRKLFRGGRNASLWPHPLTAPLDNNTDKLISLVPVWANFTTCSLRFCQRWAVLWCCGFVEEKKLKALMAAEQVNKIKKGLSVDVYWGGTSISILFAYIGKEHDLCKLFLIRLMLVSICQGTEQKGWWKWPLLATDFLCWFRPLETFCKTKTNSWDHAHEGKKLCWGHVGVP